MPFYIMAMLQPPYDNKSLRGATPYNKRAQARVHVPKHEHLYFVALKNSRNETIMGTPTYRWLPYLKEQK